MSMGRPAGATNQLGLYFRRSKNVALVVHTYQRHTRSSATTTPSSNEQGKKPPKPQPPQTIQKHPPANLLSTNNQSPPSLPHFNHHPSKPAPNELEQR
jgi:hypothetical protein